MEDDDSSNSVEAVENDEPDKPIMTLLKRLVEQTTKAILTNTQITHLIEQEFDLDCSKMHPLEQAIYIDIMKKFLKDWPQWDEFDKLINKHKAENDYASITQLLETKHDKLKTYLRLMLDTAKKSAEKAVQNVEQNIKKQKASLKSKSNDDRQVVMEVQCTRERLNNLFYKYPINDSVFNTNTIAASSKICICPPTYQSILNWWNIEIQMNLNRIGVKRETIHEFKHVLVNKALDEEVKKNEVLDTRLQFKYLKPKQYPKADVLDCLEQLKGLLQKTAMKTDMEVLLWFIRDDLKRSDDTIAIPASYRRYMNRHPYVRYLCTEVVDDSENKKKYDLALQETISPMYKYTLTKFDPEAHLTTGTIEECCRDKVTVRCSPCNLTFRGVGLLKTLQQHFWTVHTHEADWQCTNCNNVFKMAALSGQRWSHEC